ncbi:MAG: glycerol kinase GlpK [Acidobacteriota bacterium]
MPEFIGALDQGTTSTRFMIFDHAGHEVSRFQVEHRQILPRPGWVEHDPLEIIENANACLAGALRQAGLTAADLAAVGLTNQRETTVVWDPRTGKPHYNAIVWQDTRTDQLIRELQQAGHSGLVRERTGLPPATYFSGAKLRWILDVVDGLRRAAARGEAAFGTIDTWLLWNLTGGSRGGVHATDVTNASRTMLMDLRTLDWDEELLRIFHVPREIVPSIRPSSCIYGEAVSGSPIAGVPVAGILGDQQAAAVGQVCFSPGEVKNTYGTGNFMLLNLGPEPIASKAGLLTTVAYRLGEERPVYALEGSVAVTGSAVQWLRDQLGLIRSAPEVEELARTVEDTGGVYFVPAFSGLFAPYWRSDARGVVVGLSRYSNRGHLARAVLESICYQSRDVLEAMKADSGVELQVMKVDGGATANDTLMQLQADILGISVVRPKIAETTSLGAAYAAGLAVGFWPDLEGLAAHWEPDRRWDPAWSVDRRETAYRHWKRAVERSFGWVGD